MLSVILGNSTEAWHICSTPSCTGSMFRSESSINSEWQFTGVSKARLPSTSWTAATHIGRCQSSATSIFQPDLPPRRTTTSSQHARPSGVLRRRSDGLECVAWRPPRPVAQCRQFPEQDKDASVSECTWTLSALEALRNALYKFKTYLLTLKLSTVFESCRFSDWFKTVLEFIPKFASLESLARNHWVDHTRLTISRVIWRWIMNIIVTLKYGSEVTQGHWKWRGLIDHVWLSMGSPL